jgi:hypothetical protein
VSATEGRQVLPTSLLPVAVVSELERRARRSGVDPADRAAFARFLGDLVAAELPGALAETAKTLLAAGEQAERQRLKIQGAPGLPPGGALSREAEPSTSSSLPARDPQQVGIRGPQ